MNKNNDPIKLFNYNRFDIAAKALYSRYKIMNVNMDWAKKVYINHQIALNKCKLLEDDKNGINDFIMAFDNLIESLQKKGFDGKHPIPINKNTITNGAHRLATSMTLGINIKTIKTFETAYDYKYDFFNKRLLSQPVMDAMMLEYIKYKKNVKIAVIFPMANKKMGDIMKKLSSVADIVMHKDIKMNYKESANLYHLLYLGEDWITIGNGINTSVIKHLENRYNENIHTRFVFLDSDKSEDDFIKDLTTIKIEIRNFFNKGNYPIHINDTYEETLVLAKTILHEKSMKVLSLADTYFSKNLSNMIKKIKKDVPIERWDDFVIDSGGAIACIGLRENNDIDYLSEDNISELDNIKFCHRNFKESAPYELSEKEIIWNNDSYFYMFGLKFISPDLLLIMKKTRRNLYGKRNERDIRDVVLLTKLIDKFEISIGEKIILLLEQLWVNIIFLRLKTKNVFKTFLQTIGIMDYLRKIKKSRKHENKRKKNFKN